MKIDITSCSSDNTHSVLEIANFYIGRIESHVEILSVNINQMSEIALSPHYVLRIKASDMDHQNIEIREVQRDLEVATHRAFSRLIGVMERQHSMQR